MCWTRVTTALARVYTDPRMLAFLTYIIYITNNFHVTQTIVIFHSTFPRMADGYQGKALSHSTFMLSITFSLN